MTEQEYGTLAQIAPTIPQSDEYIDYGVPWQVVTTTIGKAVGKQAEAEALVADTEGQLAAIAAAHPDWKGKEMAIAYVIEDQIGAYASGDARPTLMAALGFVTPKEYDELAGDLFYSTFSWEEISRVDRDVLMWISGEPTVIEQIQVQPAARAAHRRQGRSRDLPRPARGRGVLVLQPAEHPVLPRAARPPARSRHRRRPGHRRPRVTLSGRNPQLFREAARI